MRNTGIFVVVAAAAVAVWGWIFYSLLEAPASSADASVGAHVAVVDQAQDISATPVTFITGLESLPPSLRDIEVDGALKVDAQGQWVLDVAVRHLFDYFLNAVGGEPADTIVARIQAYIRSHLPASAQDDALQVLDEYLALRAAMESAQADAEQARPDTIPDDTDWNASALRERKAALREMRSRYLSPDVYEAFYADEDRFDEYTIGKLEVMETPDLTPLQRSQRIAALEQALPAPLRSAIEAVTRHQTLAALTEQWQLSEQDASALRAIRENIVGAAAADRLEALDARRAVWRERVDQWMSERETVLANGALSQPDQVEALERRRAELFEATEIARIRAIEHLRDEASLARQD